jgi:hypothetical protein
VDQRLLEGAYDALMRGHRLLFGVVTTAVALMAMVPATVLADCNGPACGGGEQAVDAAGAVLLVVLLTVFVAVMTLGGRLVRRDRRSPR